MSEILGLLDSLEATILEAKRMPFSDKLLLEEKKLLHLLDKMRLVLSNGDAARRAVDLSRREDGEIAAEETASIQPNAEPSEEATRSAQEQAEKIKTGANEYADYILANLQLTVAKMQKNLVKLEHNIQSGREVLQKTRPSAENAEIDEMVARKDDEL